MLNYIIGGGGFSSRLMEEVREKRGLAYSVHSNLFPFQHGAVFVGNVATKNEAVGQSLEVIESELRRLAEQGPTAEELANAKSYLTGAYALRFESSSSIANQLLWIQIEDLGIDYVNQRNELIEAVSLEDIKRVAKRLIEADRLITTIVGKPVATKTQGGPGLACRCRNPFKAASSPASALSACRKPRSTPISPSSSRALPPCARPTPNRRCLCCACPNGATTSPPRATALHKLTHGARTLVFFGTGGSSLGGQTLAQLGGWGIPGDDKHGSESASAHALLRQSRCAHARAQPRRPRPQDLALHRDLEVRRHARDAGAGHCRHRRRAPGGLGRAHPRAVPRRHRARDERAKNGLRALCEAFSIPTLDHDPNIGGRFSGLTNVGLLPALARGLDAVALREGAQSVIDVHAERQERRADFAPAIGAARRRRPGQGTRRARQRDASL